MWALCNMLFPGTLSFWTALVEMWFPLLLHPGISFSDKLVGWCGTLEQGIPVLDLETILTISWSILSACDSSTVQHCHFFHLVTWLQEILKRWETYLSLSSLFPFWTLAIKLQPSARAGPFLIFNSIKHLRKGICTWQLMLQSPGWNNHPWETLK